MKKLLALIKTKGKSKNQIKEEIKHVIRGKEVFDKDGHLNPKLMTEKNNKFKEEKLSN